MTSSRKRGRSRGLRGRSRWPRNSRGRLYGQWIRNSSSSRSRRCSRRKLISRRQGCRGSRNSPHHLHAQNSIGQTQHKIQQSLPKSTLESETVPSQSTTFATHNPRKSNRNPHYPGPTSHRTPQASRNILPSPPPFPTPNHSTPLN